MKFFITISFVGLINSEPYQPGGYGGYYGDGYSGDSGYGEDNGYGRDSGYGGGDWDSCPQVQEDLRDAKVVLTNMRTGILEDLCAVDGQWNCTKVVIYSDGFAAVKQPTRFGVFSLFGLTNNNKYPSFYRPADGQYLFYLLELGQWEYWHQYERWVIGQEHGTAIGGIMIRPSNPAKKCPWHIKWFRSHSYYLDQTQDNLWNPVGNPWVADDTIRVKCYEPDDWPEFDCGCERINVTGTGRIMEYHPDTLGEYTRHPTNAKEGYLAPVFAKVSGGTSAPSYLYSHDIKGRVWLMGSTTSTWSLRLNLIETEHSHDVPSHECPFYPREEPIDEPDYYDEEPIPMEKTGWEYLQSKRGQHEVWLKDYGFAVTCIH